MTQANLYPVDIPHQRLESKLLRAVIVEFVTREGTDYGDRVFSLDEKVAAVHRQLEGGSARIVYDVESESCSIVAVR